MDAKSKNSKSVKYISLFFVFIFSLHEIVPFARAVNGMDLINAKIDRHIYVDDYKTIRESIDNEVDGNKFDFGIPSVDEINSINITTSGPNQSENSGFSLSSTDGNVDKFTGDFSYSIPLMDVEGYPISISYNSGVNMNSESSWVGLGWDLSVGAINREMRGVPDEFNGNQEIQRTYHQRDQVLDKGEKTGGYFGISYTLGCFTPAIQATYLTGSYEDSYLGLGKTLDFSVQGSATIATSNGDPKAGFALGMQFGLSQDTKQGISTNKGFTIGVGTGQSLDFASSSHSRYGLRERSLMLNTGRTVDWGGISLPLTFGSRVTYGTVSSIPKIAFNSSTTSFRFGLDMYGGLKLGPLEMATGFLKEKYNSETEIDVQNISQPMIGYLHSGKRKNFNGSDEFPVMDYERSADLGYSAEMENLPFSIQTFDLFHTSGFGYSATFRAGRNDYGTYYDPIVESHINQVDLSDVAMPSEAGEIPALIQDVVEQLLHAINAFGVRTGATYTPPMTFNFGVDVEAGGLHGNGNSGVWRLPIDFQNVAQGDKFDGTTYFKSIGEPTPNAMNALNAFAGAEPVALPILKAGEKDFQLMTTAVSTIGAINVTGASNLNLGKKPVTAGVFSPKLISDYPANSTFKIYNSQGSLDDGVFTQVRSDANRQSNHISSIDVVSPSGDKYVYGIPVYSYSHTEVAFSSGEKDAAGGGAPLSYVASTGLVSYVANQDNSTLNDRGRTQLYDKSTVPAYAHSFLLTEYLSSDYVDRGNDGPTIDDVGSYYKFNYTRSYGNGTANLYQWRFPISGISGSPKAIQNQGLLGTTLDDIASYSYGKKEIYYTHSIESKNMIAVFYLNSNVRKDAYGVIDENGILSTSESLKSLEKIVLYNLNDFKLNGATAVPLQTVYFEYNYELCPMWPMNRNSYPGGVQSESGKLTLKNIRIQTGSSQEMALSSYKFDYNAPSNALYSYSNIDAWGNYKPHNSSKPNDLYPYPEQSGANVDQIASYWKINKITNPSGGTIEIDYEADRYGFVQDNRSMRHFNITGMMNMFDFLKTQDQTTWAANTSTMSSSFITQGLTISNLEAHQVSSGQSPTSALAFATLALLGNNLKYHSFGKLKSDMIPNHIMIFKLDQNISGSLTKTEAMDKVRKEYFQDPTLGPNQLMKSILLKLEVNVKSGVKELIPAKMDIAGDGNNIFNNLSHYNDDYLSIGVMPKSNGNYEYGYVVLEPVNNGRQESPKGADQEGVMIHPFQKYALGFVRQNLPDKIYGSCFTCEGELAIDKKVAFGAEMNKTLIKAGYVSSLYVEPQQTLPVSSIIRLFEPDNIKYGGNGRVSNIRYSDKWLESSGEYTSVYNWQYDYGQGAARELESGVASFEPNGMIDENPLYDWDIYVEVAKKFPDETKFHATPMERLLYPIPVVGYEDVVVTFSNQTDYGHSVTSFHTLKDPDYRTKAERTAIYDLESKNPKFQLKDLLFSDSWTNYAFSQGYCIETNDFHGKIKSQTIYGKSNTTLVPVVISKTTYKYKPLRDPVFTLDRNNNLKEEYVAMEYDIHNDSRCIVENTNYIMAGIGFRLNYTIPYIFSFNVRPTLPKYQQTEKSFYSNCLIKHINYSAVIDSVKTEYLGSQNSAKNIVYDRYSGAVIISSLNDEFDDPLYSFSYPSHWYENDLRELPKETGFSINGNLSGNFFFPSPAYDLTNTFSIGDKVKINGVIMYIYDLSTAAAKLINDDGTFVTTSGSNVLMLLEKSNRSNRLDETMQNMVTKTPFVLNTTIPFVYPTNEIISASAITYRYKNDLRCGLPSLYNIPVPPPSGEGGWITPLTNEVENGQIINPFKYGVKGDLVLDGQYAWQGERQSLQSHGTRYNGTYESSFTPFYQYNSPSNQWVSLENSPGNWRKMGVVSRYDEYGQALEVKDQIGIRSSVLYGYNSAFSLVPVAQVVNAGNKDIAFDGFEDYKPTKENIFITESHFDFKKELLNGVSIVEDERHSGKYSLLIPPGNQPSVTKKVTNYCVVTGEGKDYLSSPIPNSTTVEPCFCIPAFSPEPGTYMVSAWVKSKASSGYAIKIETTAGTSAPVVTTINSIKAEVDGWVKIEGAFTISSASTSIKVILFNGSSRNLYVDDFRIHPFLAGMTTVVYDDRTLLPMATHDGYNFTTFYNYDENLNLVRVRVETVEGIKTISESEFSVLKD